MLPELIDSHCHLDASDFDADRDAVLRRAHDAGVSDIIVPATTRNGWQALHDLCAADPCLHAAYGLHPMFMARHHDTDVARLEEYLARGDAVAVGECGLDHFVEGMADSAGRERQRRLFEAQLALAREHDLPVIIHARRAVEDVIHCLRRVGRLRGVIHSYPGSLEQAGQLHTLGFLLGFGGPVTHERARRLRKVVAAVRVDQLLLESDAPDQPDARWRGRRNEPSRLAEVLKVVAALRGVKPEALAKQTTANARGLFALSG